MIIVCAALCRIHNSNGKCGVTEETQIDINCDGECLDYSPLTEEEMRIFKLEKKNEIL